MKGCMLFGVGVSVVLAVQGPVAADEQTVDFRVIMAQLARFSHDGGTPYAYLHPDTADHNDNDILDAVEFDVLQAVLRRPALPCYDRVHAGWVANVAQLETDLGGLAAALVPD